MIEFVHPSNFTITSRYLVAELGYAIAKEPSHHSLSPHNHTTAEDPQLKQSTIRGQFPFQNTNKHEMLQPPSPNNYANQGEVLADNWSVRPHFFRSLRMNALLSSTIKLMNTNALSLSPMYLGAGKYANSNLLFYTTGTHDGVIC